MHKLFKPKHEVKAEDFYKYHLRYNDAEYLKQFISQFTSELEPKVAILAVGSSTFPLYHWVDLAKLNAEHRYLKLNLSYNDIDMLVIPQKRISKEKFRDNVHNSITKLKMPFKPHPTTIMGYRIFNSYGIPMDGGKTQKSLATWVEIGYGIYSVSTSLKNGSRLDIILGRDTDKKSLDEKLSFEIRNNNAFSLLYY